MRLSKAILFLLIITGPAWSQAQNREELIINSQWTQIILTRNAGSRSEGYTSNLRYKNETITPWFETILIGSDRFDFISGVNLWDFRGYEQFADGVKLNPTRDLFDAADLERGWYEGAPEGRKVGTPDEWIWAGRDGLKLFIDPERIRTAADSYRLSALSYDSFPVPHAEN